MTAQGQINETGFRVAIAVSRYNAWITDALLDGAQREHARLLPGAPTPAVFSAPGTFELPSIAGAAARSGGFDAVVALGCVIKGETSHDQHIAHAVANAIAAIGVDTGVPVAFGVLTVDTPQQAESRAGGEHGNKGAEAMSAAIETARSIVSIHRAAGSAI